jgi:hypothetical protein
VATSTFRSRFLAVLTFVLAVCLATPLPALAFDPHEWARESDPNNAKTQFCVTNGGSDSWNDNAKLRAADAEAKWESAPGLNVIMDTTPEDCFPDSARIEMKWITCWPFAGQAIGYTQWDPTIQSGGGFEGTWWIAFVKYVSCDSGAALYPFNFTATGPASGSTQLDFQSLIEHEMGHAMGLHHPEAAEIVNFRPGAATYPHKSFDGIFNTVMYEQLPTGRTIRNLRQDDLSGAAWVNDRSILARPNTAEFWGNYQGSVLEDPGGYLVLTKNSGLPAGSDYSYMFMTTRITTDSRPSRETPTFTVKWRETNGQSTGPNDRLRLRIRWSQVFRDGTTSAESFTWGDTCFDTHADATWETCRTTFQIGDNNVQDMRIFIYNSTTGRVQLDSIDLVDGSA